jgi:hypothetical protein
MHHKYHLVGPTPMTYLRMRYSLKNAQDWDEVVASMVDPKETKFKAMSWDEKATVLEELTQEILKASEERITPESVKAVETPQESTKTVEIPQVTLVQARNFS